MSITEVRSAFQSLASSWWDDENTYYSSEFVDDETDPDDIPTDKLEDCNYKDLRVIQDYINESEKKFKELEEQNKMFKQDWQDMTEEANNLDRENKKLKQENKELAEVLANKTLTAVKEAEEDIKQTIEKVVEEVKESHKENDFDEWCKKWCEDNLKGYMPYRPLDYKICNGLQDEMENDMVYYYNQNKDDISSEWTDNMDIDEDGNADNHGDVGELADYIQDYFINVYKIPKKDIDNWYDINDALFNEEKIDEKSEVAYYNVVIELIDNYCIEITDKQMIKLKNNYNEYKNYTISETKKSIIIQWLNHKTDKFCKGGKITEEGTRNIFKKNM